MKGGACHTRARHACLAPPRDPPRFVPHQHGSLHGQHQGRARVRQVQTRDSQAIQQGHRTERGYQHWIPRIERGNCEGGFVRVRCLVAVPQLPSGASGLRGHLTANPLGLADVPWAIADQTFLLSLVQNH